MGTTRAPGHILPPDAPPEALPSNPCPRRERPGAIEGIAAESILAREAEAAYRGVQVWVLATAKEAGLEAFEQQEVLQRVGLVLLEKRDEHDPSKGSWNAWAVGIARNIVLDVRRGVRTERLRRDLAVSVEDLPDLSPTPEQALRARDALALVRAAVREEHREVFELNALGCTAAEIGERLALPRSAVEWRLKEARRDLARALARLREDRSDIPRVRAVVCPFASVDDVSRALRGEAEAGEVSPLSVRRASRGERVFWGWSGTLSRVVFVSLAPLVLLSVHLVTVLPAELVADRAVLSQRTLARSEAAATAAARAEAPPPVEVPALPVLADAPPVLADAPPAGASVPSRGRDGRSPEQGGRPREWMLLRMIVQDEAARPRAPVPLPAPKPPPRPATEPTPPSQEAVE